MERAAPSLAFAPRLLAGLALAALLGVGSEFLRPGHHVHRGGEHAEHHHHFFLGAHHHGHEDPHDESEPPHHPHDQERQEGDRHALLTAAPIAPPLAPATLAPPLPEPVGRPAPAATLPAQGGVRHVAEARGPPA